MEADAVDDQDVLRALPCSRHSTVLAVPAFFPVEP